MILLTIAGTFTPNGPKAGPIGGPAVASPPLTKTYWWTSRGFTAFN
ncbi:MAG: hypothetical protein QXI36_06615 [Candidatus Bathyarchaeia archaeon]